MVNGSIKYLVNIALEDVCGSSMHIVQHSDFCHEPPNSPKSIFIFLFFFFSFNYVITSNQ